MSCAPTPESLADDLLDGAPAIAAYMKRTQRWVYLLP